MASTLATEFSSATVYLDILYNKAYEIIYFPPELRVKLMATDEIGYFVTCQSHSFCRNPIEKRESINERKP